MDTPGLAKRYCFSQRLSRFWLACHAVSLRLPLAYPESQAANEKMCCVASLRGSAVRTLFRNGLRAPDTDPALCSESGRQ